MEIQTFKGSTTANWPHDARRTPIDLTRFKSDESRRLSRTVAQRDEIVVSAEADRDYTRDLSQRILVALHEIQRRCN